MEEKLKYLLNDRLKVIIMNKNNEKEIVYLQDKINYLNRKKEILDTQLKYSMLDVQKLTDVNKRVKKSNAISIIIFGLTSAVFLINNSFLTFFLIFSLGGIAILDKFYQQDKTNKDIIRTIENNKKMLIDLETICDDIEEYNLKLKKIKESNQDYEEITITRGILNEYITKKEELSYKKVKKLGGNYGKNI